MEKCAICSQPAPQRCSACHLVSYCSREHQKKHWKTHKLSCKSWTIASNDILGRHLIAAREIKPGEIIIKEAPLIYGPPQQTVPVCLGECGKVIQPPAYQPCAKCGWPLCGAEKCAESKKHIPECEFTQRRGQKVSITNFTTTHPNYQCITVLRMLYQRDNNKELWDKLMQLQSHCEEMRKTEKYEAERIQIAQFIRSFFKLEEEFTEEEILRVCGILLVNGHEVPLTEPPSVAIYSHCSLFEHNCRPNSCKSFAGNSSVLVHAGCNISAGEHLSICYTDWLWGTANRRHYLAETKFFNCECERCKDVTEFGTWFSAIRCTNKECKGYLLPETFLTNPSTPPSPWSCSLCSLHLSVQSVDAILERVGLDLAAMQKGDISSCQLFLNYYEKILHPNHYYLIDVRLALAQLIGQKDGLNEVGDEEVELKSALCSRLIELVGILNPAEVRLRGSLLFDQHAAVAEIARRRAASGSADPGVLRSMLAHARELLAASAVLLQHEPIELPEGQFCAQAKKNLKQIDQLLQRNHLDVL